jgi:hypothetical protein
MLLEKLVQLGIITQEDVQAGKEKGLSDDQMLDRLVQLDIITQDDLDAGRAKFAVISEKANADRQAKIDAINNQLTQNEAQVQGLNSTTNDGIRGASQGLTLNLGDEATAGISSLVNGTDYDSEVAYERLKNERAKQNSPYAYGISELAGTLPAGIATGGLGTGLKAQAAAGGLLGAVQGFGQGEGTVDSLKSAASGGIIGGALGGALSKPVLDAAGRVIKGITKPFVGMGNYAADLISPTYTIKNEGIKAARLSPENIAERERLNQRIMDGIMTPAQRTGSNKLASNEQLVRESVITTDDVSRQVDIPQQNKINEKIKGLYQSIGEANGHDELGVEVQDVIKSVTKDLAKQRKVQAAEQYGELTQLAPDKAYIAPNNVMNVYRDIIKRGEKSDVEGLKSASEQAKQKIRNFIDDNSGEMRALDVQEALNNRSEYSKLSAGTGKLYKDIDVSIDRKDAIRLRDAAEKDFEEAAMKEGNLELQQKWKIANDTFRDYSQRMDGLADGPIAKLLGKDYVENTSAMGARNSVSGEAVIKKLNNYKPSEIKQVLEQIDSFNPSVGNKIRSTVLADALEKGNKDEFGDKLTYLNYNKVKKGLSDDEKLKSFGFSDDHLSQIEDVKKTLGYLSESSRFANTSKTDIRAETRENLAMIGNALATGGKSLAFDLMKKMHSDNNKKLIANAMSDPKGLQAMQDLLNEAKTSSLNSQKASVAAQILEPFFIGSKVGTTGLINSKLQDDDSKLRTITIKKANGDK